MEKHTIVRVPQEILNLCKQISDKGKDLLSARLRKDRNRERNIKNEIEKLYKKLLSRKEGIINYIEENLESFKAIDLESFIKPDGVCEAISIGMDFKMTQLRRVFHQLKAIRYELKKSSEEDIKLKVLRLSPLLAYAKGRDLIDENFYEFVKSCITKIEKEEDFERFLDIFEAIVAYRRFYEPKQS